MVREVGSNRHAEGREFKPAASAISPLARVIRRSRKHCNLPFVLNRSLQRHKTRGDGIHIEHRINRLKQ